MLYHNERRRKILQHIERERQKTEEEHAEDIAYTLNHALACTATDFVDPVFSNYAQKWFGRQAHIGCTHDHHHGPQEDHLHHWIAGELIGDFGAVPITIAAQYYAPAAMDVIQSTLEPFVGGLFYRGAERTASKWAEKNGISKDSDEYKERVAHIYEHEIDHLPQAVVWTASSIALNLATQKVIGNNAPLWQLAASKATGAGISSGLLVGFRGVFPGVARHWDHMTSKDFIMPATKALGGMFGVSARTVDRMIAKEEEFHDSWADKVDQKNSDPEQTHLHSHR